MSIDSLRALVDSLERTLTPAQMVGAVLGTIGLFCLLVVVIAQVMPRELLERMGGES